MEALIENKEGTWTCKAYATTTKGKRKLCGKGYKSKLWLEKHINEKHINELEDKNTHQDEKQNKTPTQSANELNSLRFVARIGDEMSILKKEQSQLSSSNKFLTARVEKLTKEVTELKDTIEKMSKVVESTKNEENESYCIVCWENPNNNAFVPCGHKTVCGTCAAMILSSESKKCPLCRVQVYDMLQIWE